MQKWFLNIDFMLIIDTVVQNNLVMLAICLLPKYASICCIFIVC